mmetsp:Transcript_34437/g.61878  ORF Transcript_34437/g.61878 Transcript_34437/m.61878 type:complete len:234 (-) Transcript_34437:1898-2599(-)
MPATHRSQRLKAGAAATPAPIPMAMAVPKKPAAKGTPKKGPPIKTTPKKKSPYEKSSSSSPRKKKRTGLKDAVDTSAPLGVIDPGSKIQGLIENLDGEPCDVMLALVDPPKHSDKFFVLQLIRKTEEGFVVYTRWGRTGTSGQALEQEFDALEAAVACFKNKFKQKTGLEWGDRVEPMKQNKYLFVVQSFKQKQAGFSGGLWQYWVDDGIDGKAKGWYDYSDAGSRQAERLYQ